MLVKENPNKTRPLKVTIRTSEDERKEIYKAQDDLDLTLTELLLEGIKAIQQLKNLTK